MSHFPELWNRAQKYCARNGTPPIELIVMIGHGTDGNVWETNRQTAVKAFIKDKNYLRERNCYLRLMEDGIETIDGLAVPRLFQVDDDLMIVEIEIVNAPYLLDFGKAYIDEPSPFTAEQVAEYYRSLGRYFQKTDIPRIRKICRILSGLGIEYLDARPSNIRLRTDEEERLLPDDDWENESTDLESSDADPQ